MNVVFPCIVLPHAPPIRRLHVLGDQLGQHVGRQLHDTHRQPSGPAETLRQPEHRRAAPGNRPAGPDLLQHLQLSETIGKGRGHRPDGQGCTHRGDATVPCDDQGGAAGRELLSGRPPRQHPAPRVSHAGSRTDVVPAALWSHAARPTDRRHRPEVRRSAPCARRCAGRGLGHGRIRHRGGVRGAGGRASDRARDGRHPTPAAPQPAVRDGLEEIPRTTVQQYGVRGEFDDAQEAGGVGGDWRKRNPYFVGRSRVL